MGAEVWHNFLSSEVLYFVVFDKDGLVYHVVNDSFEVWGAGISAATDYAIVMTETDPGQSNFYEGDFPILELETYKTIVRWGSAGPTYANADLPIAQGQMNWNGEQESTPTTIEEKLNEIIDATTPASEGGGTGGFTSDPELYEYRER